MCCLRERRSLVRMNTVGGDNPGVSFWQEKVGRYIRPETTDKNIAGIHGK